MPDYQGIGIGTKFIKEIAKLYKKSGYEFNLTTTTPALVHKLAKDKEWNLSRFGRINGTGYGKMIDAKKHINKSSSKKRITYSFDYNP